MNFLKDGDIPLSEIRTFETDLLSGELFQLINDKQSDSLQKLIFTTYEEDKRIDYDFFLCENFFSYILKDRLTLDASLKENLTVLESSIKKAIESHNSYAFEFNVLLLGVCSLQKFVEKNWTGPNVTNSLSCEFLIKLFHSPSEKVMHNYLSLEGESIYENVKGPELLIFSNVIFSCLKESKCSSILWWKFRCSMIHQHVLPNKSATIYKNVHNYSSILLNQDWVQENQFNQVQLYVEICLMNLYYHEVNEAKVVLKKAQDITNFEFELSGAIGKRTQYQQKPVAQLLVKSKSDSLQIDFENQCKLNNDDLPCDLLLKDDVLLNKVQFIEETDNEIQNLTIDKQIILLAHCSFIQKSQAAEELRNEKLLAYIDFLLEQKTVWGVHYKSLFMRCKLEQARSRKVERAMVQLEELLKNLDKSHPDVYVRQNLFYSILFPPFWTLELELGNLLLSLGAVKSALEVYQRINWWDGIVKCCYLLNRKDEVAKMVREKLAENETPTLWCLLGDVNDDINCYLKAWELSDHKSAHSQASLGNHYYKKQDYLASVSYFEKSLELNHLQSTIWFSLGYAASQTENYELSARAYRQVTMLDSDNFEAWNNLANAYIRLKQKQRAYYALQEAIKCNFEDWRVWENFLLVCIDVGAFEEAIHACHRILDIKKKFEDSEVLEILTKAVIYNLSDSTRQNSSRLRKQLLQLFGRITSIIINNGDIWQSYASLHLSDPNCLDNSESMAVVIKYLQKSLTFTLQKPHSLLDVKSCRNVLSRANKLAEMYQSYCQLLEGQVKTQAKSQANLALKNVIVRVEKQIKDFNPETVSEVEDDLKILKDVLNNI